MKMKFQTPLPAGGRSFHGSQYWERRWKVWYRGCQTSQGYLLVGKAFREDSYADLSSWPTKRLYRPGDVVRAGWGPDGWRDQTAEALQQLGAQLEPIMEGANRYGQFGRYRIVA